MNRWILSGLPLNKMLPVKSIQVAHPPVCIRRKILSILSIKIQLKWELISIIYLHFKNNWFYIISIRPPWCWIKCITANNPFALLFQEYLKILTGTQAKSQAIYEVHYFKYCLCSTEGFFSCQGDQKLEIERQEWMLQ